MKIESRIRRGYFDGPTGQVHYRLIGARGGRPLLLLHQIVWSSHSTDYQKRIALLVSVPDG